MDEDRILRLLDGETPTIDDYRILVTFCDAATSDLLWQIASNKLNLHWMVKATITQALQDKFRRERKEEMSNRIWEKVERILREK